MIVTLVLSCTVSEILQVFCAPEWPHLYSTFSLDQITDVGVNVSRYLKLLSGEIIREVFQPVWSQL